MYGIVADDPAHFTPGTLRRRHTRHASAAGDVSVTSSGYRNSGLRGVQR